MMSHYDIDNLRESMVKILGADGQSVAGSGFIMRSDGYLITCHHVIYLLDFLKVEYQGQIYEAEWCEELSNPEVDIAILKIDIEDAKAVPIINPQHLSTSVTVYGFPPAKKTNFPEGFAVSAQSIRRSAPLNTVSTYRTREIKATNPWNKLPQDESTFLSHRIDAKVDAGTSGGAVFAEELGGVVGVIQCSKSDESYVIRWDNITEYLDKLGLEPEKKAVCRFLEEIENNFKYDKLLHIPEQPIILKDQYIPIQVTLERRYTHAVETTWGYAESEAELKQAYALKRLEESQQTQVDWKEAKKQHQRIIVLADPGMGKSTLLRREACLTAQEERQSLKNNTKKLEDVVFPLFLRLSDLAETPEEIIDAIPVLIQRECSETATQVMELLRENLKIGKCLLLLDALDEVPTEHRKRLFEKLNRFAQRKSPYPIICTSRIVGYSGAFVVGVKEVEIVPFSQKQIEQYIETWFRNAAGYLNDDTVSASSLIQELRNKPQIRGLAQNPLLLSLICSLYQEKGLTLPARRCQVYEQAVRYMLGKWSKNRNPELDDPWIDAKTELLEELAYQFSCDGKEIFTLRELRKTIDEYLRSGNASTDFDNLSASHLISELSEQDGILQKLHKDSDQYLFLHRTFQEYLTACYLNRARDSIALAKAHFWEYDWHETLGLLAGLMKNPVPLIQAITSEKDDIFSTLLLLAGRCVAECEEISHPLITQIIDTVYRAWNFYPDFDLIKSTVVALGQANSQMLERLQEVLNDKNIRVREREAWALGEIRNSQAVEPLIQALKDEDSNVRQYAAWALGEIGSLQAVEELISALSDEHINVRGLAIGALGKIGSPEVVTRLISALNQEECSFRWCAAKVLGQIGTLEALGALISALNREKWTIRAFAAEALGDIDNPKAVQALVKALNDENSDVRCRVAEALGRISSPKAVKALIKAFNDENDDVRYRVAEALEQIGDSQAFEVLFTALKDKNSHVKWHAAQALGQMGSPEVVEALISALDENDTQVRWYVVLALGKTRSLQAIEALIKVLECDEDSFVKEMAARALGQIGSLQAVEALISALKDKNSSVRGGAAVALGKIRSSKALEALIKALNDREMNVRWSAAIALGKIGNLQAAEALIKALNEEDEIFVKQGLISSLDEIANPKAVEALIKALNDKAGQVKTQAAQTLGKIGTLETLEKLIQLAEIDIYDPDIFLSARTLAVRFRKEKLPFIPVYPELVAHKQ
jgi:HEAT repeat protein/phage terminase Nu1 subunit (DNA packaging protein)